MALPAQKIDFVDVYGSVRKIRSFKSAVPMRKVVHDRTFGIWQIASEGIWVAFKKFASFKSNYFVVVSVAGACLQTYAFAAFVIGHECHRTNIGAVQYKDDILCMRCPYAKNIPAAIIFMAAVYFICGAACTAMEHVRCAQSFHTHYLFYHIIMEFSRVK